MSSINQNYREKKKVASQGLTRRGPQPHAQVAVEHERDNEGDVFLVSGGGLLIVKRMFAREPS